MITINNSKLYSYINGNTKVTIYKDGTKIRRIPDNEPERLDFPESIDLKITNKCSIGCPYCHEGSTPTGLSANIPDILSYLSGLPEGVELAIGGGDITEVEYLDKLIRVLDSRGFIVNVTINANSYESFMKKCESFMKEGLGDRIKGVGISIPDSAFNHGVVSERSVIKSISIAENPYYVMHLIIWVNSPTTIYKLYNNGLTKILVLGYKSVGRGGTYASGKDDQLKKGIEEWRDYILRILENKDGYFDDLVLSFDNLAIEQLGLKNYLPKETWDKFYMGDDFTHSMYIDAVTGYAAPTSRSPMIERVKLSDVYTALDYFRDYCKR